MCNAKEINEPPPVNLLLLPHEKLYEGQVHINEHRKKEYCYKVEQLYVIYSKNTLGEGYSFTTEPPYENCNSSKGNISRTNQLGVTVGTSIIAASNLLGIELSEGNNTITWRYKRPIHNVAYDDQTILNIIIKNGKVYALDLFNTVTH